MTFNITHLSSGQASFTNMRTWISNATSNTYNPSGEPTELFNEVYNAIYSHIGDLDLIVIHSLVTCAAISSATRHRWAVCNRLPYTAHSTQTLWGQRSTTASPTLILWLWEWNVPWRCSLIQTNEGTITVTPYHQGWKTVTPGNLLHRFYSSYTLN